MRTVLTPRPASVEIRGEDEYGRDFVLSGNAIAVSLSHGEWGDVTMELKFGDGRDIFYTIEYPQIKDDDGRLQSKHF